MSEKYISPFMNNKNRHDFFVKQALKTYPGLAKEFFTTHLPKDLSERINLSKLEFCDTELFKGAGGQLIGDILIKTEINQNDAYLVLLPIEHQSSNDPLMPFRQLEYLVHILAIHIQQQEQAGIKRSIIKLPFVYQTVIYHGRSPCNFSNDISQLVDAPKEIVDKYFLKPYRLIDFTQIPDEQLRHQHEVGLMGLALKYVMKKGYNEYRRFEQEFEFLLNEIKGLGKDEQLIRLATFVLEYILSAGRFDESKIIPAVVELAERISEESGEHLMSLTDVMIEQGRKEGHKAGLEAGRQAGLEAGRQAGLEEGEIAGERKLVSRQLQRKFGNLSSAHSQQLKQLNAEKLLEIGDKLIEAESIDELFKGLDLN